MPAMLALSPPSFSTFGWPLDDPISNENNHIHAERESSHIQTERESSESFLNFPSTLPQEHEFNHFTTSVTNGGDSMMVKKLNHNASERDRRKRINTLYSSLRSLLPEVDRMKKLSNPATVTRMLKYIPELQQQVKKLNLKKEELLSMISRQRDRVHLEKQKKRAQGILSSISTSWLGNRELMIQISTFTVHNSPLSELLLKLEEDGLNVIDASSFKSYQGRIFYNLHLQVEETQRMEDQMLREKLLSLYEKKE